MIDINFLIARAHQDEWFQFQLAKLFGQRMQANDEGHTLIGYHWRDKLYVTEIYKDPKDL